MISTSYAFPFSNRKMMWYCFLMMPPNIFDGLVYHSVLETVEFYIERHKKTKSYDELAKFTKAGEDKANLEDEREYIDILSMVTVKDIVQLAQ